MFSAVNMGRKSTKSDCKIVLVDLFGFEQPYCFLTLGDDPMDEIHVDPWAHKTNMPDFQQEAHNYVSSYPYIPELQQCTWISQ